MAKKAPEKVMSLGEIVKSCLAVAILFVLVFGAISTFIVPPMGIAVLILGFCLLLVFGKIYGQNEKTEKEKQVPQARQNVVAVSGQNRERLQKNPFISQAQQIEDAAQQIIDGLGLLRGSTQSRPLGELLSYLVDGKLLSHLESKLKSSGISVEQVIDAVERKVKESQGNRVTVKLDKLLADDNFDKKADKVMSHLQKQHVEAKMQLARPVRVNDLHAGLFIERQEMIEITYISGTTKIYMVGKEGDMCHCFRLKSNPDIIKVRRYSTDYPFELIHTQRAKHNKHPHFQQVSLDKKTNTEKTKSKTLISWRLFERQWKLDPKWHNTTGEFEDVYYDSEIYRKQCDEINRKIENVRKERIQNSEAKTQIEYNEWIEITWISGDKKISGVGKEEWQCFDSWDCHCWRLNSNNNIIKVRQYMNADYPFYLIDTQGAKHSKNEFFEEVSFDRKTNTEKTETKKLISWRLLNRLEFNKWLNSTRVSVDNVEAEKQWIKEIAAKRRETD